jgi:hypothetical protein
VRHHRAVLAALLLVALTSVVACGQDAPTSGGPASTEDTGIPVPARAALGFSVADPAGTAVLTVDLAADGSGTVSADFGVPLALAAGPLRSGKRSWTADGQPVADVKLEGSGKLKVRDPAGATLWVLKPSGDDKTKVLEGEDVETYSVQARAASPGDAKVKKGDAEVGAVKSRSSGGAKVELADGTTVFDTDLAPAPGLAALLMDRIPPRLRALLVVEWVDRFRP